MDNLLSPLERHFSLPEVAEVPLSRPLDWIAAGWNDLWKTPAVSLTHGFVITGALALILSYATSRPYLFTAAVSGFFLIGPILAVGLYAVARRVEAGAEPTLKDALDGWRRNFSSVGMFGLLLAVVAIGWERLSAILFAMLYDGHVPDLSRFMSEVFLSGDYPRLVGMYLIAGGLLASLVFAIGAVSLPLMMDRDTDMVTAMMASIKAVAANAAPMALWAALIVFFCAIGFATFLLGMIFVAPMLGYATWHAYKSLIR